MLSVKKQKSISSFFGSQSQAPAKPSASTAGATSIASEETDDGSPARVDNEPAPSARPARAARRRKHVIEDEEIDEPDRGGNTTLPARPAKRRKDGSEASPSTLRRTSTADPGHSPRGRDDSSAVTVAHSAPKRSKPLSDKTSRYLFSSSPAQAGEDSVAAAIAEPEDEREKRRKNRLHEQFVKKLGQPTGLPWQMNGRNGPTDVRQNAGGPDDLGEGEDESDDVDDTQAAGRAKSTKKGAAGQKRGPKLTPLERQILDIKREHMDTVLVVEVGYKFRFFGEDARTAAKELSIVCIPGKLRYDEHPAEAHLDRFASASVPVHRLHVHVKRLVDAGHKVGVVRQLETAALKAAGDNRNAPFVRKLTNLYTKGTYIDEVENAASAAGGGAPPTGYLLCITETNAKGWGTDEKVHVGILAVQPATGDVVYDDFEDGFMRSEIESRLLHIAPCEFLIVGDLSKATEKIIDHLSGSSSNVFGEKTRVERVPKPKTMAAQAYSQLSTFYADKMKAAGGADGTASKLLDRILQLPEHVTVCLSAMITHLTEYGLEHVFDLTKYFQPFGARSHLLLNGNTLTSLEIYKNQTDLAARGSLFWCLDRTRTRFGQRLLRKWVGRPLLDRTQLEERIAAVDELKRGDGKHVVEKLKGLLGKSKIDLEKSLIRVYYGKCTRPELLGVLHMLQRIGDEFAFVRGAGETGLQSTIVNDAILSLPRIAGDVVEYLDRINPEAARRDDKYAFFREEYETEAVTERNFGIASVEHELDVHRAAAAEKLRKKKVDYVTVSGIEVGLAKTQGFHVGEGDADPEQYLIEVENALLKNVPASWTKISGTKKVSRFHTPEVVKLMRERDQHKEALAAACDGAFAALLVEMSSKYQGFRDCVQSLAVLDCLLSLADVAGQPGYVRPEYMDRTGIVVEQGRHPMVEQILLDSYVPNDISLSADGTRALLVTGPNMGGKSSYVRQVALIAIMAQIGSYVPAARARLGLFDAVFTRMGAFDNMMAGESTFMVELSETSDMLKQATPRSLVILDELGRGTSTHDGVAIAQAVLDHVVRDVRCLTLFITHHQALSGMARAFDQAELRNVHMRFAEKGDDGREILFLYEVAEGVAHRSYGLNVARLANVPSSVIDVAAVKSRELERKMTAKRLVGLSHLLSSILSHAGCVSPGDVPQSQAALSQPQEDILRAKEEMEQLVRGVEQL